MAKLIWERVGDTRDLRLTNSEAFDKGEYQRILKKFAQMTGTKLSERLLVNLVALHENPENAVLTFQENRFGYDGLNRWCTTEGKQFSEDEIFAACKVWKFLFGQSHPPTLARPLGKSGIAVNAAKWNSWYNIVSNTETE